MKHWLFSAIFALSACGANANLIQNEIFVPESRAGSAPAGSTGAASGSASVSAGNGSGASASSGQPAPINITVSPVITNNNTPQISNDTNVSNTSIANQSLSHADNQMTPSRPSTTNSAANPSGSSYSTPSRTSSDPYTRDALCQNNIGNPSLAALCAT